MTKNVVAGETERGARDEGQGGRFDLGWEEVEKKNSRIHKLPQSPRPPIRQEVELCFISCNGAVTLVSLMSSTINRVRCRSATCQASSSSSSIFRPDRTFDIPRRKPTELAHLADDFGDEAQLPEA